MSIFIRGQELVRSSAVLRLSISAGLMIAFGALGYVLAAQLMLERVASAESSGLDLDVMEAFVEDLAAHHHPEKSSLLLPALCRRLGFVGAAYVGPVDVSGGHMSFGVGSPSVPLIRIDGWPEVPAEREFWGMLDLRFVDSWLASEVIAAKEVMMFLSASVISKGEGEVTAQQEWRILAECVVDVQTGLQSKWRAKAIPLHADPKEPE
jgi:hypothetical protein